MAEPALAVLVRFKSRLSLDEILAIVQTRIDQFRALGGLTQKYYLHNEETGEIAGLYLWASREAFDEFRQSELRATIAAAYQTVDEPKVEIFDVKETLRP